MIDNELDDEPKFWREMIQLWEIRYYQIAPKRMYEALELATAKAKLAEARELSARLSIH